MDALEQVKFWKDKAGQQRKSKNELKVKLKGVKVKFSGKIIRALDRMNKEEGKDGNSVKERMAELISKDTADVESDWSGEDVSF